MLYSKKLMCFFLHKFLVLVPRRLVPKNNKQTNNLTFYRHFVYLFPVYNALFHNLEATRANKHEQNTLKLNTRTQRFLEIETKSREIFCIPNLSLAIRLFARETMNNVQRMIQLHRCHDLILVSVQP